MYRDATLRRVAMPTKRDVMYVTDPNGYQQLGYIPEWALAACAGCGALRQREINTPEMLKRPGYKVKSCKKCNSTRFVTFSAEMRPWFIEDLTGYGASRFTCTSCGVPYGKWGIFGCGCSVVRSYGLVKEQKKTIGTIYTRRHQSLQTCRLCCYGMYTAEKKGELFVPPKDDAQPSQKLARPRRTTTLPPTRRETEVNTRWETEGVDFLQRMAPPEIEIVTWEPGVPDGREEVREPRRRR